MESLEGCPPARSVSSLDPQLCCPSTWEIIDMTKILILALILLINSQISSHLLQSLSYSGISKFVGVYGSRLPLSASQISFRVITQVNTRLTEKDNNVLHQVPSVKRKQCCLLFCCKSFFLICIFLN